MKRTFFVLSAFAISLTAHADPSLLFSFPAKGDTVGLDAGVVRIAVDYLPALPIGDVALSGSSSGSLMAALFSCYGFGEVGLARAKHLTEIYDKEKISSSNDNKLLKIALGEEIGYERDYLTYLLGEIFTTPCTANLPVMIVASNFEINDVRLPYPIPFVKNRYVPAGSTGQKALGVETLSVYSRDPIFGKLKSYLGRACTYFVDKKMAAILAKVPENRRQCDLRVMEDLADLKSAVYASTAEPTYFFPYADPHPERIRVTEFPNARVVARHYNGGYAITNPVRDIKLALPRIYAFSTGRADFDWKVDLTTRQWFLVPLNQQIRRQRWYMDAEIPYSNLEWNGTPGKGGFPKQSAAADADIGAQRALECFEKKRSCVPTDKLAPRSP